MIDGWWVTGVLQSPNGVVILVSWTFWLFFGITLHELGHGWAAVRLGDRTPIDSGHMTWNPLVHTGPMSLAAFAFFGLAWGAMPVDPTRMRGRYAEAIMAFAGPMQNLSLAVAAVVLGAVVGVHGGVLGDPLRPNVYIFFQVGAWLNVALFIFNLMPVPPLDGSRILANFSPAYARFIDSDLGRGFSFIGFFVAFMFVGMFVFSHVAIPASHWAFDQVERLIA